MSPEVVVAIVAALSAVLVAGITNLPKILEVRAAKTVKADEQRTRVKASEDVLSESDSYMDRLERRLEASQDDRARLRALLIQHGIDPAGNPEVAR